MVSVCIAHSARSIIVARGQRIKLFPRCVASLCKAAAETAIPTELVVADYPQNRDDGPPLVEWLPVLCTIPLHVVEMAGEWDKGKALNAAAARATGDVLFFLDCDFLVPAEVLRRGTAYAREGKAWFPGYLAENGPGGPFNRVPTRMGCGNMFLSKQLWERFGAWRSATEHGVIDQPAGQWFAERGLAAEGIDYREPVPGFVHLWHPKYLGWRRGARC